MWKVESIQRSLTGRDQVRLTAEWDQTLRQTLPMDSDDLKRKDVRVGDSVTLIYAGGCWTVGSVNLEKRT